MHIIKTVQLRSLQLASIACIAVLTVTAWSKEQQRKLDDRGSDTTVKAFMVILAIVVGTVIGVAVKAYIGKKKAEIHD